MFALLLLLFFSFFQNTLDQNRVGFRDGGEQGTIVSVICLWYLFIFHCVDITLFV